MRQIRTELSILNHKSNQVSSGVSMSLRMIWAAPTAQVKALRSIAGVGARSGVIVEEFADGGVHFRCPPGTRRAGKWTDKLGTDCGFGAARVALNSIAEGVQELDDAAERRQGKPDPDGVGSVRYTLGRAATEATEALDRMAERRASRKGDRKKKETREYLGEYGKERAQKLQALAKREQDERDGVGDKDVSLRASEIAASELHDAWRKPRLLEDGTYEPRMKDDGKGGQVDIANTDYVDLPEKWQAENRDAAKSVIDAIVANPDATDEELADAVHEAWMKRNGSWAPPEQMVPYADLPEDEKQKDRDVVKVARDAMEKARDERRAMIEAAKAQDEFEKTQKRRAALISSAYADDGSADVKLPKRVDLADDSADSPLAGQQIQTSPLAPKAPKFGEWPVPPKQPKAISESTEEVVTSTPLVDQINTWEGNPPNNAPPKPGPGWTWRQPTMIGTGDNGSWMPPADLSLEERLQARSEWIQKLRSEGPSSNPPPTDNEPWKWVPSFGGSGYWAKEDSSKFDEFLADWYIKKYGKQKKKKPIPESLTVERSSTEPGSVYGTRYTSLNKAEGVAQLISDHLPDTELYVVDVDGKYRVVDKDRYDFMRAARETDPDAPAVEFVASYINGEKNMAAADKPDGTPSVVAPDSPDMQQMLDDLASKKKDVNGKAYGGVFKSPETASAAAAKLSAEQNEELFVIKDSSGNYRIVDGDRMDAIGNPTPIARFVNGKEFSDSTNDTNIPTVVHGPDSDKVTVEDGPKNPDWLTNQWEAAMQSPELPDPSTSVDESDEKYKQAIAEASEASDPEQAKKVASDALKQLEADINAGLYDDVDPDVVNGKRSDLVTLAAGEKLPEVSHQKHLNDLKSWNDSLNYTDDTQNQVDENAFGFVIGERSIPQRLQQINNLQVLADMGELTPEQAAELKELQERLDIEVQVAGAAFAGNYKKQFADLIGTLQADGDDDSKLEMLSMLDLMLDGIRDADDSPEWTDYMANLDRLANRTRLGFMRAQEGKEPYWPDPNSDAPDPELVAHVSRNIDSFEEKLPEWIEAFKNIPEDDFVTRTALLQQMENNFMRIGSDLEVADSDLERYQALAIALTELATTGDTSWQKMAPEQPDAMDGGADFPGFANLPKSKEESIDAIQQMFPDISREQIEESLYNSGVGYTNALLKIDIGELLNEAGIGDPPDDATDDPDYYDPAWSMAKFSDISEAGERAIQAFEEAGDDEKAAKVRDLLNDLESMDRLKDSDIGTVFNDGKLSASTKSRLAEEISDNFGIDNMEQVLSGAEAPSAKVEKITDYELEALVKNVNDGWTITSKAHQAPIMATAYDVSRARRLLQLIENDREAAKALLEAQGIDQPTQYIDEIYTAYNEAIGLIVKDFADNPVEFAKRVKEMFNDPDAVDQKASTLSEIRDLKKLMNEFEAVGAEDTTYGYDKVLEIAAVVSSLAEDSPDYEFGVAEDILDELIKDIANAPSAPEPGTMDVIADGSVPSINADIPSYEDIGNIPEDELVGHLGKLFPEMDEYEITAKLENAAQKQIDAIEDALAKKFVNMEVRRDDGTLYEPGDFDWDEGVEKYFQSLEAVKAETGISNPAITAAAEALEEKDGRLVDDVNKLKSDLLSAYRDGEISENSKGAVEAYLSMEFGVDDINDVVKQGIPTSKDGDEKTPSGDIPSYTQISEVPDDDLVSHLGKIFADMSDEQISDNLKAAGDRTLQEVYEPHQYGMVLAGISRSDGTEYKVGDPDWLEGIYQYVDVLLADAEDPESSISKPAQTRLRLLEADLSLAKAIEENGIVAAIKLTQSDDYQGDPMFSLVAGTNLAQAFGVDNMSKVLQDAKQIGGDKTATDVPIPRYAYGVKDVPSGGMGDHLALLFPDMDRSDINNGIRKAVQYGVDEAKRTLSSEVDLASPWRDDESGFFEWDDPLLLDYAKDLLFNPDLPDENKQKIRQLVDALDAVAMTDDPSKKFSALYEPNANQFGGIIQQEMDQGLEEQFKVDDIYELLRNGIPVRTPKKDQKKGPSSGSLSTKDAAAKKFVAGGVGYGDDWDPDALGTLGPNGEAAARAVPVGTNGINTVDDAVAYLAEDGDLSGVPDDFLRNAVWTLTEGTPESQASGVPPRFTRFGGIKTSGYNGKKSEDPRDKTWSVTDNKTGKIYVSKTADRNAQEYLQEIAGNRLMQELGMPSSGIRISTPQYETTDKYESQLETQKAILLEHASNLYGSGARAVHIDELPFSERQEWYAAMTPESAAVAVMYDRFANYFDRTPANFMVVKDEEGRVHLHLIDHGNAFAAWKPYKWYKNGKQLKYGEDAPEADFGFTAIGHDRTGSWEHAQAAFGSDPERRAAFARALVDAVQRAESTDFRGAMEDTARIQQLDEKETAKMLKHGEFLDSRKADLDGYIDEALRSLGMSDSEIQQVRDESRLRVQTSTGVFVAEREFKQVPAYAEGASSYSDAVKIAAEKPGVAHDTPLTFAGSADISMSLSVVRDKPDKDGNVAEYLEVRSNLTKEAQAEFVERIKTELGEDPDSWDVYQYHLFTVDTATIRDGAIVRSGGRDSTATVTDGTTPPIWGASAALYTEDITDRKRPKTFVRTFDDGTQVIFYHGADSDDRAGNGLLRIFRPGGAEVKPSEINDELTRLGFGTAEYTSAEVVRQRAEDLLLRHAYSDDYKPTKVDLSDQAIRQEMLQELARKHDVSMADVEVYFDSLGRQRVRLTEEKARQILDETQFGNSGMYRHQGSADGAISAIVEGAQASGLDRHLSRSDKAKAGASASSDMGSGGAYFTFVHLITDKGAATYGAYGAKGKMEADGFRAFGIKWILDEVQVVQELGGLARTGDTYGSMAPHNTFGLDTTRNALQQTANNSPAYEYVLPGPTPLAFYKQIQVGPDFKSGMTAQQNRDKIISEARAAGVTEINGVPIEDFVVVAPVWTVDINQTALKSWNKPIIAPFNDPNGSGYIPRIEDAVPVGMELK